MMIRRVLVLGLFLGLAGWVQGKPDIVFILADDLGYGDVGCFGQEKNANTPLELYTAKADPFEGKNVVAEHPEVAGKILSIMKEAHTPSEFFPLIAGE